MWGRVTMFNEAVRRGLSVEVTFEQKPEGTEGARHADGGVGVVLGEGTTSAKVLGRSVPGRAEK